MPPSDRLQALPSISLARPREVAAAGRLGDLLAAADVREGDLPPLARRSARDRFRVICLTAPVDTAAREDVLVDVAEALVESGADVTVVWRGRADASRGLRARVVEAPFGAAFCDLVPPCDLVIAGCWDLVLPARRLGVAPVVLLEQGDLAALGTVPDNLGRLVRRALRAAERVWCVDPGHIRHLRDRYGVDARALPAGAGTGRHLVAGVSADGERDRDAVLRACEALVEALPTVADPAGGRLLVEDLPLAGAERERLRARLETCQTRDLLVPVAQPAVGDLRIVRWRVVGLRDDAPPGETRVWMPMRSDVPVDDAWHQDGIDLLRRGDYEGALDRFAAACESGTQAEQAVAGRWAVVSLLATNRPGDAAELAGAFARDFPTHPDYVWLAVVAARAARLPIDVVGPLETLRLLGEGSQYDEWFEDPYRLLVDRLVAD